MNLVFLGLPGTGKGTQAKILAEKLAVPHIATGDIFRSAIANKTELGQKLKQYLEQGALVPDQVTCGIMEARLQEEDAKQGFILDGFPRTIVQGEALDESLSKLGLKLDGVVYFAAGEDVLIARLSGRRVCESCGATYHLVFNPPAQKDLCQLCGGKLIQRHDDREATVKNRLIVNRDNNEDLRKYYESRGLLITVDAENPLQQVTSEIFNKLGVS